jgi:integrase
MQGYVQRLELDHLAPHDLRRTCANLCHVNGGELEQIQFLLGHASVLTTERYWASIDQQIRSSLLAERKAAVALAWPIFSRYQSVLRKVAENPG